jgi:hypothetical protein
MFVCAMPKKSKKSQTAPAPNFPPHHPDAIAHLADAMPWKTKVPFFEVGAYIDAICKLHARAYSYAEIADWLNERLADKLLGKKIKRGQVYRAYQQWLAMNDPLHEGLSVPNISDEEAELNAELSDKSPKSPENEPTP